MLYNYRLLVMDDKRYIGLNQRNGDMLMDVYTSFAQVYDLFMDSIPYDDWCNYLEELLKKLYKSIS